MEYTINAPKSEGVISLLCVADSMFNKVGLRVVDFAKRIRVE